MPLKDRFRFVPASNEAEDDAYELLSNENVGIQCSIYSGKYILNEYGYQVPGDEGSFFVKFHSEHEDLEMAFRAALDLAAELDSSSSPLPGAIPNT